MVDQTPNEQVAVADRDARKIKRAGQTSITLFVVFAISLLAFGKAPFAHVTGDNASAVNFDAISCLGIAMGVFAAIFLLLNFRRVLRLGMSKKVLGLIGCFGLIVHTVLALFMPLSPASMGAFNPPIGQRGPEEWIVDGRSCKIASTYYLRQPEGFQYTIEYPYQFSQDGGDMNDDRALAVAFPLMKYAYTNSLHTHAPVSKIGQEAIVPSRFGVVMFEKDGRTLRVYRIALSMDQIKRRIQQESAATSAVPSSAPRNTSK